MAPMNEVIWYFCPWIVPSCESELIPWYALHNICGGGSGPMLVLPWVLGMPANSCFCTFESPNSCFCTFESPKLPWKKVGYPSQGNSIGRTVERGKAPTPHGKSPATPASKLSPAFQPPLPSSQTCKLFWTFQSNTGPMYLQHQPDIT